jgi:hypothetical protein
LQVFENDEHIANFLTYHDSILADDSEEIQDSIKELSDQSVTPFPKDYVSLESLFTRDNQKQISWIQKKNHVLGRFKRHKKSTSVLPSFQSV